MSQRCLCTVCRDLFEQPGALLFAVPDQEGLRTEFHICPKCAATIESGKQKHPYQFKKTRQSMNPAKCVCCQHNFNLPGGLFFTVPDKFIRCRAHHLCPRCCQVILS